jgi:hypothetical protein
MHAHTDTGKDTDTETSVHLDRKFISSFVICVHLSGFRLCWELDFVGLMLHPTKDNLQA